MRIDQPSSFIAGREEFSEETPIVKDMSQWLTDLRGTLILDHTDLSVPMERPTEVNQALLGFLKTAK